MPEVIKGNKNPLVIIKHKKIEVEDIENFDLILGLNVFYHLTNCEEIVKKVKKTAKHLIYSIPSKAELSTDAPVYPEDVKARMKDLGGEVLVDIPTIRGLPRSVKWLKLR